MEKVQKPVWSIEWNNALLYITIQFPIAQSSTCMLWCFTLNNAVYFKFMETFPEGYNVLEDVKPKIP